MISGYFLINLHVQIYERWVQFSDNTYNLSVYESRDICLFETLTKVPVFKKSDFSINKYYWSVKTNDGCFYYTRGKDIGKYSSHHANF